MTFYQQLQTDRFSWCNLILRGPVRFSVTVIWSRFLVQCGADYDFKNTTSTESMTIFWKELTRLSGSKEKRNDFLTNVQWCMYVFTTKFRFIVHDKVTRQNRDPYIPECRLTTGQRSFAFSGAKIWNGLPKDVKCTENIQLFSRRLFNFVSFN